MAENRFLNCAAPWIADLHPYVPGKPLAELERELGISDSIKLASNENPLGAGARARAAIEAALGELSRYPEGSGYLLRNALVGHHGVAPECITLGNGSNDVLDLIARAFLAPGTEAVLAEHAFAVYPIATQSVGATVRIAPARDYGHDLNAMAELVNDQTRVVWIANPNNPTGTWLDQGALEGFLAALPERVVCVVDEAYFEYVAAPDYPDATRWLERFPNLVVTRTFSKVHGLAALRVGYGLSHPDIAALLNRVRQPFNVNTLAQVAAAAALGDEAHVARTIELNRNGIVKLTTGFTNLGLNWIPSVGNFVTVDVGRPAGPVNDALLREGVIVRPVGNYGLPNHLRISVGRAEENARFLKALEKVLAR